MKYSNTKSRKLKPYIRKFCINTFKRQIKFWTRIMCFYAIVLFTIKNYPITFHNVFSLIIAFEVIAVSSSIIIVFPSVIRGIQLIRIKEQKTDQYNKK